MFCFVNMCNACTVIWYVYDWNHRYATNMDILLKYTFYWNDMTMIDFTDM